MLNHLKLHHIGYVVTDIKNTAKEFELLGFSVGEILYDPKLTVELCYLEKKGSTPVELVSQHNPESLEQQLFNKNGVMPYHLCFECNDIYTTVKDLESNSYNRLFDPVEVAALGGKKICYLHKKEIGYIEIVEM